MGKDLLYNFSIRSIVFRRSYFTLLLQNEGVLFECMDACFGLSRKRSQGEGFTTPKHKDLFFGDQDDVDNFVDHYSETSVSEHVCLDAFAFLVFLPIKCEKCYDINFQKDTLCIFF